MPLIDDLENFYKRYTNKTFSFLPENGILKTEISSLMLLYDTIYYNVDDTIQFFCNRQFSCIFQKQIIALNFYARWKKL